MKITKKKLIGGILAVLLFGGGLFLGGTAFGNSSWTNSLVNSANAKLVKTASDKVNELSSTTNLEQQMQALIQPEIEAQQRELELLLEEYYRMKLEGLTETEDYVYIEERIEAIKVALLNRYKTDIDAIFK